MTEPPTAPELTPVAQFAAFQAGVRDGSLSAGSNVVRGTIAPPAPGDVTPAPRPGSAEHGRATEAGLATLRAGELACVVLNGGMATRFGGVVKGLVEAVGGHTFLEVKLAQTRALERRCATEIPVALMTSWATDAPTRDFLAGREPPSLSYFSQYVSLRLRPDGEVFRGPDGEPSPYSTGHGDFLVAFRASGTLRALRDRGVRHVFVSNIDNLAARLDPVVVGAHVLAGRSATLEVGGTALAGGGSPALVDGRMRFLEEPQFPAGFDRAGLTANLNSITFTLDGLDRPFDPPWLFVTKTVDGHPVVQFERNIAAGCDVLATTILEVPTDGPATRFLPIKTRADLVAAQPVLRRLLTASDY